jgi:hypothetical protein
LIVLGDGQSGAGKIGRLEDACRKGTTHNPAGEGLNSRFAALTRFISCTLRADGQPVWRIVSLSGFLLDAVRKPALAGSGQLAEGLPTP